MSNTNSTTQDYKREDEQYAEELGTLVFQSALMRFLVTEDEKQTEAFNSFVQIHVETDSFLEDLCNEYPEFEKLLREEISLLQEDIAALV